VLLKLFHRIERVGLLPLILWSQYYPDIKSKYGHNQKRKLQVNLFMPQHSKGYKQ
jgi:hypothetical protein